MEPALGDRLRSERALVVGRSDHGRGRMKEVVALLGRAGVRQSSMQSVDMHGLCFWTCAMLEYDEREIAGEARRNSVLNMRNVLWLMLTESPAVCMQALKRLHALARAVGHNKSISKTRARYHHLWKNGFTRILVQQHLYPGDFEHRLRPIELISGYDASEDLTDTASSVGVRQHRKRRARTRPTVGQIHALPLRGAGVELAPRRQTRLDRGGDGPRRAARAERAHEVRAGAAHDEPCPVVAPGGPLIEIEQPAQPIAPAHLGGIVAA
jgi:hypothetical protein